MPSPCAGVPVRLVINLAACFVWTLFSLPSIVVSLNLYFSLSPADEREEEEEVLVQPAVVVNATGGDMKPQSFPCYHNYTVYFPVYERFR